MRALLLPVELEAAVNVPNVPARLRAGLPLPRLLAIGVSLHGLGEAGQVVRGLLLHVLFRGGVVGRGLRADGDGEPVVVRLANVGVLALHAEAEGGLAAVEEGVEGLPVGVRASVGTLRHAASGYDRPRAIQARRGRGRGSEGGTEGGTQGGKEIGGEGGTEGGTQGGTESGAEGGQCGPPVLAGAGDPFPQPREGRRPVLGVGPAPSPVGPVVLEEAPEGGVVPDVVELVPDPELSAARVALGLGEARVRADGRAEGRSQGGSPRDNSGSKNE